MNNENNLVNETNNVQPVTPQAPVTPVAPATPVAPVQPTPVAPATPVAPVQPTPAQPVQAPVAPTPQPTPVVQETPHYSTPKINVNIDNDRVFKGGEQVQLRDESKDYKAIEEQLGSSEVTNTSTNQPQVASVSVAEVNNEISKDNILSSITLDEDDNEQSGDAESVTFDYNEIYGNKVEEETNEVKDDINKEVFSATEINIQDRTRKKTDIAPEFNLNALEGNETVEKSQDKVLSEKQQDRADTRRKIMFIGIIVIIIIVALEFIFPMFV